MLFLKGGGGCCLRGGGGGVIQKGCGGVFLTGGVVVQGVIQKGEGCSSGGGVIQKRGGVLQGGGGFLTARVAIEVGGSYYGYFFSFLLPSSCLSRALMCISLQGVWCGETQT